MSVKKSKRKPIESSENRDAVVRTRILRVIVIIMSILLVLSMVLSLIAQ